MELLTNRKKYFGSLVVAAGMLAMTIVLSGCQTLREIAQLRLVDFAIDNVSDARLAGIQIERLQSYEDLSPMDAMRIGQAVASRELPFRFNLNIAAQNPEENQVQARLVRMDWTLFLEDRETISGVLDQNLVFPPGQTTTFPVSIELDLVDFFDRNLRGLVELALSVSGQGGEPKNVSLQAIPTIDTPLGEMEYPRPVTILSRDFGSAEGVSSEP